SAVDALSINDKDLAQQAIAFDSEIDQKEKDIEAICLRLLLHQQPVATDLRKVSSALKMITDMERIGDMASDISEITMMDSELLAVSNLEHISQMEKETIQMVNESIKAFVKKDIQLAQKVIDDDDIVDALFEKVKS
ncbi:MAG: phosphate signaling complex PhoU family protein, partial [Eubacteriales bacterium]